MSTPASQADATPRCEQLVVFTPTVHPYGGIIKIFDYALHALMGGWPVVIVCVEQVAPSAPIFRVPGLEALRPGASNVSYRQARNWPIPDRSMVLYSWPPQLEHVKSSANGRRLPSIHLLQNVADPRAHGTISSDRFLSVTQVAISGAVANSVRRENASRERPTVVRLGHRLDYFHRFRGGDIKRPIRVAYTRWKSSVGDAIAHARSDSLVEYRGVGGLVEWPELRELYRWSDVFLCTPWVEEGSPLCGLEAMAAGAILVTPPAGGNVDYCDFGVNCLEAQYENVESYLSAIDAVRHMSAHERASIRRNAFGTMAAYSLDRERVEVQSILDRIATR